MHFWEHPEILISVGNSPFGETKDQNNPIHRKNLTKKYNRGVRGYWKYKFDYIGNSWLVKLEVHKNGFEQPYHIEPTKKLR